MDFELTRSQKEIQNAALEFARGEFNKDQALELESKHEFPTRIWQKEAELGFIGIHFPEKYAGQGLGVLENILVAEKLCTCDSTLGSEVVFSSFASECILCFGSDEQKERFLPQVAQGKMLSAGAFTEAIQLLGGYGYITEYELERFYRDAKITEIYEGAKEIQKNTIASAIPGRLK